MEPATAFASMVVMGASAWLITGSVKQVVTRVGMTDTRRASWPWVPVVALAGVLAVAGVVWPVVSHAVTPPPSIRTVTRESPVNVQRAVGTAIGPNLGVLRHDATYTVAPGDSLWKIAKGVLVGFFDPPTGSQITELWKDIYRMNRETIGDDPNLIMPGQVLSIPGGSHG